jgi:YHS domain-containing protein
LNNDRAWIIDLIVKINFLIPALIASAIATSAFASDPGAEKPVASAKTEAVNTVCPVSGDKVGGDMGKPVYVEYKGQKYAFCCKDCAKDFKKNPDKYAALAEKNRSVKSDH